MGLYDNEVFDIKHLAKWIAQKKYSVTFSLLKKFFFFFDVWILKDSC